jgi:hypothetical protein
MPAYSQIQLLSPERIRFAPGSGLRSPSTNSFELVPFVTVCIIDLLGTHGVGQIRNRRFVPKGHEFAVSDK